MPSLDDLARAFAAVTTFELVLGLLIVVAVVVLVADWRISLLALALQYILVAILLSTLIPLQIAAVRMIAGGVVATMFYITALRTQPRRRRLERHCLERTIRSIERADIILGHGSMARGGRIVSDCPHAQCVETRHGSSLFHIGLWHYLSLD